jgi:hypothetical protein
MVVIDKLNKFAHFIPIKSTFKAINIVEIFMKEIFRLHGIPKMLISDRDVKFTSTNRWTDRKDKPNHRRYALHVCKNNTKQVGRLPTLGGIYV